MNNSKFFKSGLKSSLGSLSQLYKKGIITSEDEQSPEVMKSKNKTPSSEGGTHSSKQDKSEKKNRFVESISYDKLVRDLNSKVDKVLGKETSNNPSPKPTSNTLEDIEVDQLITKEEYCGLTIVDGDIFKINESGFYYASSNAINTPTQEAGYFILEVLSPKEKLLTFVNHDNMSTFIVQQIEGQWTEWLEDIFFSPFLKDKLEALPTREALNSTLNEKVDKVSGKMLSSNDFTDADKTKLDDIVLDDYIKGQGMSLNDKDGSQAEGILTPQGITSVANASGSENYPTPYGQTWTFQGDTEHRSFSIHRAANGRNLFIKYWNADSSTSDWIKIVHPEDVEIGLANKVDKVVGKGLSENDFTNSNKTKLDGISSGANNYVHPNTHSIHEVEGLETILKEKESAFTKKTGFNKHFGKTAGTVMEGDDSRVVNGQIAYSWGNHAQANYVQTDTSGNLGLGTSTPEQKLHVNGIARFETPLGYLDLGSLNSHYYQISTDQPQFYMNKTTEVDGDIKVYGKETFLSSTDGGIYENGYRVATRAFVNQKEQNITSQIERNSIASMVVNKEQDQLQLVSSNGLTIASMSLDELRKELLKSE